MSTSSTVRRPDRVTAAIVALAILLGGMPLTLGIAVHSSETMFTLDICHPVQSFSYSPVAVVAILPALRPSRRSCLNAGGLPSGQRRCACVPPTLPTRHPPKRALPRRAKSDIHVTDAASRAAARRWHCPLPRLSRRRSCARGRGEDHEKRMRSLDDIGYCHTRQYLCTWSSRRLHLSGADHYSRPDTSERAGYPRTILGQKQRCKYLQYRFLDKRKFSTWTTIMCRDSA